MRRREYQLLVFLASCAYGVWISFIASHWSFDYSALIESIEYYRKNGYDGFLDVLLNNTVLLVIWDSIFSYASPEISLDLLYGFAATFRFYVFFTKFRSRLTVPVFLSTSVVMDINTCRYSLIVTLIIVLLPYVNKYLLMVCTFPLHALAPAWAFLLSPASGKFLLFMAVVLFSSIAPEYFTRHFADLDETFPRIALVYAVFAFCLLVAFRKIIRQYVFNYILISIGVVLVYLQGNVINFAYFYRLADLAFQTILVHILFAKASTESSTFFTPPQTILLGFILSISIIYSYVLIGGNIWRFF